MASKKKQPEWRDECLLRAKVSKIIEQNGREKVAVFVDGFHSPITIPLEYVQRAD
jgi:transcription antitermination factor NusG